MRCRSEFVMADAEVEVQAEEGTKTPLIGGPLPGVSYPIKVVYCGGKSLF